MSIFVICLEILSLSQVFGNISYPYAFYLQVKISETYLIGEEYITYTNRTFSYHIQNVFYCHQAV